MDEAPTTMTIEAIKLSPPRNVPMLARDRLFAELDTSTRARISTVVAGAGFGKSSLIVGWLRARAHTFAWYRLDETDRDLTAFKAYLAAALRSLLMQASGGAAKAQDFDDEWKALPRAIDELIRMIGENPLQDLFVVLDDFHQVNDAPEIVAYLDSLISMLPLNLHLVILSRKELNLDVAGLRAGRELVEIGEADLCFDAVETERLFAEVFGCHLSDDEIEAVKNMTEGWASGLVLCYHALKSGGEGEIKKGLDAGGVPQGKIFEYLQHTAYRGLDESLRDFLIRTSILSRLHPDFCDAFLGRSDARQCLSFLAGAHLFTIPLSEEGSSYRYHQLFRAFLQERLIEELSPQEIKELHMKAAGLWEQRGNMEEALRHYVDAGDHNTASLLLQGMAEGLVHGGRVNYLQSILSRIPPSVLGDYPDLVYYRSLMLEVMGKYQEAIGSFIEAAALYEQRGEHEARANCLVKTVKLNVLSGRPAQAGEQLNIILDLLHDLTIDSESWYELAAMLGAGAIYSGLTDLAQSLIAKASAYAEAAKKPESQTVILYWCGFVKLMLGDYHAAGDFFERARKIAERNRFEDRLVEMYCYLSLVNTALGDFEAGRKLAESGLGLVRKMGSISDTSSVSIGNLQARALSLCMLGEAEKALEDISSACRLCEGTDNIWLAITSLVHAGMIYQFFGENEKALGSFERAEALCKESRYTDNELLCRLARFALAPELPERDELRREIAAIMDALRARATRVLVSPSYLLIVQIEQRLGNTKGAHQALEKAIAIDEKSGCIVWWKLYGRMIMPTLIAEFAMGKHLGFLSRVFACLGNEAISRLRRFNSSGRPEVRKAARELTRSLPQGLPQPIKVKMLGNFELIRGGKTIDASSWKSKKALFIIKYLAAHHSTGFVPREVLMELLWPDKDPVAAAKNLNTALTSLRRTLEPKAKWGDSRYLESSGDSLRLQLQGGSIDFEEFLSKIREAERARLNGDRTIYLQRLHEAEELYAGDFLAEDLYDGWCQAMREDLHRRFVELLTLIAREYERHGDRERATIYLEKVASIDPGREEICRRLMEQYHYIGNRAGMERAFKRCRDYLSESLDLAPSRETVELYERLRNF